MGSSIQKKNQTGGRGEGVEDIFTLAPLPWNFQAFFTPGNVRQNMVSLIKETLQNCVMHLRKFHIIFSWSPKEILCCF